MKNKTKCNEELLPTDLLALDEWAKSTYLTDRDKAVIRRAIFETKVRPTSVREIAVFAIGFFEACRQVSKNNALANVIVDG